MPYRLNLTWMPHANRWRKRYRCKTYYLKTHSNGRKDRDAYLAALREWERLKAYLDDLGPNPYTESGVLIPEDQLPKMAPLYFPPLPVPSNGHSPALPQAARSPKDPPWILSVGIGPSLHPEQVISNDKVNPYTGERRIEVLADYWIAQRQKQAERGDLSLKQWSEDMRHLCERLTK